MNCEAFMDYAYDEYDIAIEGFHPIIGLQNIIMKLISAMQRLFNNFKKLRKITVPKDMAAKYHAITNKWDALPENLSAFRKVSGKDNMVVGDPSGTEKLHQALDEIIQSNDYKVFVNAEKRSNAIPKSDYIEIDSKQCVDFLNDAIKALTKAKIEMNKCINPKDESRAAFNALVKKYTIIVKINSKLLSFRKPIKDPNNITEIEDGGVKAKVYV